MEEQTIVNSVSRAARDVFGMMLGIDIEVGKIFLENGPRPEREKVVALIGLAGQWIGTGVLECAPAFACRMASLLLTTEFHAVNEDVLDAFAEMSNMIFGNVKTELEAEIGAMSLSIPTVIFGRNFATRGVGKEVWRVFPLKAGSDEIELKFCLTPSRDLQRFKKTVFNQPADLASVRA